MGNLFADAMAGTLAAGAIAIAAIVFAAYILFDLSLMRDSMSSAAENWHLVHPHMKAAMFIVGIVTVFGLAALMFYAPTGQL